VQQLALEVRKTTHPNKKGNKTDPNKQKNPNSPVWILYTISISEPLCNC